MSVQIKLSDLREDIEWNRTHADTEPPTEETMVALLAVVEAARAIADRIDPSHDPGDIDSLLEPGDASTLEQEALISALARFDFG